jgi:hypothetical protein
VFKLALNICDNWVRFGREPDIRNIDQHDVRGAALEDLSDHLHERGRRRLHGRRRGWQGSGAQHVVRARPDQHQLIGIEASVRSQVARNLLIDGHFHIADHIGQEVIQVGRRRNRRTTLRVAESALRSQCTCEVDRKRRAQRVAVVLRDILRPHLPRVGRETPATRRVRDWRIGPDVRQAVAE